MHTIGERIKLSFHPNGENPESPHAKGYRGAGLTDISRMAYKAGSINKADFSTAVGSFFEGGHEAFPCTGYTATLRENRTNGRRQELIYHAA